MYRLHDCEKNMEHEFSDDDLITYFVLHVLNSCGNTCFRLPLTLFILRTDRIVKSLRIMLTMLSSSIPYFIAVIGQSSDCGASSQLHPALYGLVAGFCLSVVLNIYLIVR